MTPKPRPEALVAPPDCASEPIHLSGAIQPHGYLLSCALPDWTVRHASANVAALLEVGADHLLEQTLREYVADEVLHAIYDVVDAAHPGSPAQRVGAFNIGPLGQLCDVSVHAAQDMVHVEIEPRVVGQSEQAPTGARAGTS